MLCCRTASALPPRPSSLPPLAPLPSALPCRPCPHCAVQGKLTLRAEPVDLHALADSTLAVVQPLAKRGVALLNEVPPGFPAISGDPGRLTQVLSNLVGNAIKFTHQVREGAPRGGEGGGERGGTGCITSGPADGAWMRRRL